MFKDNITIRVKAGKGGDGAKSFRREKFMPNGGPDGGDGGKGGNVFFQASREVNTLSSYSYNKLYQAEPGENGMGSNKTGASGEDLVLIVPVGTVIYLNDKQLLDLSEEGKKYLIAKGGKGGFGNARFKTSVRQAPNFAVDGEKTEEITLQLELKVLADVGLVGFPNAGKSTFLSVVTNAKPKIGNYHFTTLEPNLGVANIDGDSFVIADIPGLIEGASKGEGLGDKFLKHIERTRILLIMIDVSGFEMTSKYQIENLNKELKEYGNNVKDKRKILVATKIDSKDDEQLQYVRDYAKENNLQMFEISSVTNTGTTELLRQISKELKEIPKCEEKNLIYKLDEEYGENVYTLDEKKEEEFKIVVEEIVEKQRGVLKGRYKKQGGAKTKVYKVSGPLIDRLAARINMADYESIGYFQTMLDKLGVFSELKRKGIKEGDVVIILDYEFEWYE